MDAKPNIENIRKWAEALESGEYKQGVLSLRPGDGDSYCCLGVACDVSEMGVWKQRDGSYAYRLDGQAGESSYHMPTAVREFYGITAAQQSRLINMNDEEELDFKTIALHLRSWFGLENPA